MESGPAPPFFTCPRESFQPYSSGLLGGSAKRESSTPRSAREKTEGRRHASSTMLAGRKRPSWPVALRDLRPRRFGSAKIPEAETEWSGSTFLPSARSDGPSWYDLMDPVGTKSEPPHPATPPSKIYLPKFEVQPSGEKGCWSVQTIRWVVSGITTARKAELAPTAAATVRVSLESLRAVLFRLRFPAGEHPLDGCRRPWRPPRRFHRTGALRVQRGACILQLQVHRHHGAYHWIDSRLTGN